MDTNHNFDKRPSLYKKHKGLITGLFLTLILALLAGQIARLPFFSIMGIMILSILVGSIWRAIFGEQIVARPGIIFSSKILLRAGIILMGLRLDFREIISAGLNVIAIDAIVIVFTLVVMMSIGKALKMDKHLTALIAVGTAVCGAAAIVATAPLIKGKSSYTALAVAIIASLGTIGALVYIFLYPILPFDPYQYGVLTGSTLHELAHVVAAGTAGGNVASETAILVKLGRVALLIPVVLVLGYLFSDSKGNNKLSTIPVPWFIFGFLLMSIINSMQILSEQSIHLLINVSVYLMAMAMAGLGLSINFSDFIKAGPKPILLGILGFIALAALGPFLLLLI